MGYKWLQPKKWYNRLSLNFNAWYSTRLQPFDYQNWGINTNFNGQLKTLWNVGVNAWVNPASNDFYELRQSGYVFHRPPNWGMGFWFGSNESKNII